MPRYNIRLYYSYMDAYEVVADSIHAAEALVDAYQQDTDVIVKTSDNEFFDYDSGLWTEIDADGHELTDPEEL